MAEHIAEGEARAAISGAFTAARGRSALAEAKTVDELPDLASLSLAGVPVAVCERFSVAGQHTRHGSNAAVLPVASRDHEVVRRLRGAGAVVIGSTRSSELGLWASTDDGQGPLANPWRADRGVAGPSGGAAVVVADGTVPLAVGSDGPGTAGGVRTTAAACGLIGVSAEHDPAEYRENTAGWLSGAAGVLATTVGDAAEAHAVLTRTRPSVISEPHRLRIAATDRPPIGGVGQMRGPINPDAETVESLLEVVRTLTDLGHDTRRFAPNLGTRASGASFTAWAAAAGQRAARFERARLQRRTRRLAAVGDRTLRGGLSVLFGDGARTRAHVVEWFTDHGIDVLVTPALAAPAAPGENWSRMGLRENLRASARAAAFTAVWGLIGLPALVLPVGTRADGLPSTIQLIAPPGGGAVLFDLASQLVDVCKPRRYPPAVIADGA
ncbi:amidase family protein [Stackebrandtia nassauensis]|uniref:amidase family protein n=1 Tax=Stackebrandtia nassauensis TaxID=283811 RepID=UPI0001A3A7FC|nr:amidase family protein [Stackebrandtia nassauensis]